MIKKPVYDISNFVNVRSEQEIKIDLVNRVVMKRKQAKITQVKLAKLTGVSCGSIRRFEQTGEISLSSLIKIASCLQSLLDFDLLFAR